MGQYIDKVAEIIAKAKYFLNQIEDIKEIEVEEK